jgi:hypothetical protein
MDKPKTLSSKNLKQVKSLASEKTKSIPKLQSSRQLGVKPEFAIRLNLMQPEPSRTKNIITEENTNDSSDDSKEDKVIVNITIGFTKLCKGPF